MITSPQIAVTISVTYQPPPQTFRYNGIDYVLNGGTVGTY